MLIDSHCHLTFPDFDGDREDVIKRAREKGVTYFLSICTQLSEIETIHAFVKERDDFSMSIGVHPHEATQTKATEPQWEAVLRDASAKSKVVGLGETGLDFYYDHSDRSHQEELFRGHCALSQETGLPLIIHTREAESDTIRILDMYPGVRGVFHCFSGSQWLAEQALERGFTLSFSGIVTFKKAEELREVVKLTPLDRMLVETDAPYLSPIPYRGQRNEPAFLPETASVLAALKNVELAQIAQQTSQNFHTLFSHVKG